MKPTTEIINDLLGYDGLKIIQRPDIFNFSLDSTLVAYFVTIKKNDKKIIDLGCGNAPIPLFLSLRTNAQIIGVEIQPEIADLATRSVSLNKRDDQIKIINANAIDIYKQLGVATFDVVVSNPPYFKCHPNGNINQSIYKTYARHEISFSLDNLLTEAKRLLKDGGTLAMVHRASRFIDILETMRKYQFEPKRIQFVYPKVDSSDALAILIEAKKLGKPGDLKVLKPLYVNNLDGGYTEEILKIFRYPKE